MIKEELKKEDKTTFIVKYINEHINDLNDPIIIYLLERYL